MIYQDQSSDLSQSGSETIKALEEDLHHPQDPVRRPVLAESSSAWFESRLEYSCVSLAKLAMSCPLDLTGWQQDFLWCIAKKRRKSKGKYLQNYLYLTC